jgi:hypothetical protein
MSSILLRKDKTTPLTFDDMDNNFLTLLAGINRINSELKSGSILPIDYIRSLFSSENGILYNSATGTINLNTNSVVTSLNGRSGNITLTKNDILYTTDDIPEGLTNSYYTDSRIKDALSRFVTTSDGITKISNNDGITILPRNFNIRLTGAVTGVATVNNLNDVNILTNPGTDFITTSSGGEIIVGSRISNLLIRSPGQLNESEFQGLEFSSVDFDVESLDSYVRISNKIRPSSVIETIGKSLSGTIILPGARVPVNSGINIFYDNSANLVRIAPRDFTIEINGAVTGSATVSRLRDATITVDNINNYISGLNVITSGLIQNSVPVTELDFNTSDFLVTINNNRALIDLKNQLTDQEVRDIIGTTIRGTQRDFNQLLVSETGIITNYDRENNVLEVAPRDFNIQLSGDVTGNATVSRLRDVNIITTTNAIKGLDVDVNGGVFATLVKKLNFSNNFLLTHDNNNNTVTVDFRTLIDNTTIRNSLATSFSGSQNGISVEYNEPNQQFSFNLNNLNVSLAGAVVGTGTLVYSGNQTQTLSLVTELGDVGTGLEIRDEGTTKGDSVSTINFVGAGVTSSVTVDGRTATVNIPNSPGAEKFILIDSGSANVPNSRRLQAGTGIVINDQGPGDDVVISASGGEVLGKIQVESNGRFVAEEPTLNVVSSQQLFIEATHDNINNVINIIAFSKEDGWYRQSTIDFGLVTDKYGNKLDMGIISSGIIEHQINFGEIA